MLGKDNIPVGQFNGTDAYLYYWQAEIVVEHGNLPPRDMHRWLPIGRDLGQTLNLYSYVVAYAYKGITPFFATLTLYDVMLVAPVVCFVLSLGVLCGYLYHVYGLTVSSIVGVLLATLPVTILRSIVGFSDRDSWCLLLGVAAVTTYLWKFQTQQTRHRYLLSAISGGLVFFGGLSWEGFGVFVITLLFTEVWQFLTTDEDNSIGEYLVWILMFVPSLYLASPAYRSGTGFSTYLTALVLLPPLVLLGVRYLRHLFITAFPLTFFTANLVQLILNKILEKITAYRCQDSQDPIPATIETTSHLRYEKFSILISSLLKGGITVVVLVALLFWAPMGKHASRIVAAATQTRKPFPGHGATKDALDWMKIAFEKKHAVVAASWEYGSVLNVLGGVKTAIDQDHFIPYWIHLYCRHVFAARSSPEALEFLKTHGVTHLMLMEDDLLENTGTYSYVGSHENLDRFGNIVEMVPQDPAGTKYQMVPSLPNTPLVQINIDFDEDKLPETLTVHTLLKSDEVVVDMPYIAFFRKKRFENEGTNASAHGGVVLYFDDRGQLSSGYYVSPNGWNLLAFRLFFHGVESPHFVPVYPQKEFPTAKVKVWEIHYPPDIRSHPKYNATAPKE